MKHREGQVDIPLLCKERCPEGGEVERLGVYRGSLDKKNPVLPIVAVKLEPAKQVGTR